ncbi:MAG: chorismate mutase [Parcubacteria group bacterium]|nr:chorismate mutase [Parcubacteria group bacterium]
MVKDQREKINQIDSGILKLLEERAREAQKIGREKKKAGLPVFSPVRFDEVVEGLAKQTKLVKEEDIRSIYREVQSAMIALQGGVKIGFLGERLSLIEEAVREEFGRQSEGEPNNNIEQLLIEVRKGNMDLGVVPQCHPVTGSAADILFEVGKQKLSVIRKITVPIHFNLVSRESKMANVAVVYGVKEALDQCQKWLQQKLGKAELRVCDDNQKALFEARKKKNTAALVNLSSLPNLPELKPLAKKVEDKDLNHANFWVVSREKDKQTAGTETAVSLAVKNRVGALRDVLNFFVENGVDLTYLQSKQNPENPEQFLFFITFKGSQEDEAVKQLFAALREECPYFSCLGSY